MEILDLGKYLDERGRDVLVYSRELQQLGLTVLKSEVGRLEPAGSGGILTLYDLSFWRRDDTFGAELIDFLRDKIHLSPAEVERLEKQSESVNPG